MIFDTIDNASRYFGLFPSLDDALSKLAALVLRWQGPGRLELDGDKIYANCSAYQTSNDTERLWENHKEYCDIHIVVNGSELVQYATVDEATKVKPYNAKVDATLYKAPGTSSILLRPGYFIVFFPGEIHRPSTSTDIGESYVEKLVVKVAINENVPI